MEIRLSDEEVARLKKLLEIMNQQRTDIGMTIPGDAERTRAWQEYDKAQKEIVKIFPLATEPLD